MYPKEFIRAEIDSKTKKELKDLCRKYKIPFSKKKISELRDAAMTYSDEVLSPTASYYSEYNLRRLKVVDIAHIYLDLGYLRTCSKTRKKMIPDLISNQFVLMAPPHRRPEIDNELMMKKPVRQISKKKILLLKNEDISLSKKIDPHSRESLKCQTKVELFRQCNKFGTLVKKMTKGDAIDSLIECYKACDILERKVKERGIVDLIVQYRRNIEWAYHEKDRLIGMYSNWNKICTKVKLSMRFLGVMEDQINWRRLSRFNRRTLTLDVVRRFKNKLYPNMLHGQMRAISRFNDYKMVDARQNFNGVGFIIYSKDNTLYRLETYNQEYCREGHFNKKRDELASVCMWYS